MMDPWIKIEGITNDTIKLKIGVPFSWNFLYFL